MAAYRRRQGNDTWHFCGNCSNYPRSGYIEHPGKPTTGELCNECKNKKAAGNCS